MAAILNIGVYIDREFTFINMSGWEPTEIISFFHQVLYHKQQLVHVKKVVELPDKIKLVYQSVELLAQVDFYYSNDAVLSNSERTWLRQDAVMLKNKSLVRRRYSMDLNMFFFI